MNKTLVEISQHRPKRAQRGNVLKNDPESDSEKVCYNMNE